MERSFLEEFISQMDTVINFVMLASDNIFHTQEYEPGCTLTMIEMHTLSKIADNPGICVSDIARIWDRTLGAVSQNVNSLYKKGYVEKKKLPDNKKTVHLYPTAEGQAIADFHKDGDKKSMQIMLEKILEDHTIAETRTFLSVLSTLVEIMQEKSKL